jgi:hypothetical protein
MLLCGTPFYLRFYTQFIGPLRSVCKICNYGAQSAADSTSNPNVARLISAER